MEHETLQKEFKRTLERISDENVWFEDLTHDERTIIAQMLDILIKQDPDDPKLIKLKGLQHYHQEQYDDAVQCLKKALTHMPDDEQIPSLLAWSLFEIENYDDALPYLEEGSSKYPNDTMIQFMTGFSLYKGGNLEKAKSILLPLLYGGEAGDLYQYFGKQISELARDALKDNNPVYSSKPPSHDL